MDGGDGGTIMYFLNVLTATELDTWEWLKWSILCHEKRVTLFSLIKRNSDRILQYGWTLTILSKIR